MALEKRRGFHPNHKNIAKLLVGDLSNEIAEVGAKRIQFAARAQAVGAGLVDTGDYSSSFKRRRSMPLVRTTWGKHATWEVYNDAQAAAAIEFGGRQGAGPREPQRILFKAAMIVHHPMKGTAKVGRARRGMQ